jgi:hypothetical protein
MTSQPVHRQNPNTAAIEVSGTLNPEQLEKYKKDVQPTALPQFQPPANFPHLQRAFKEVGDCILASLGPVSRP